MITEEIATALVVLGTTGTMSMLTYQVAVKSSAAELLPVAAATRVRWWSDHLLAALCVSVAVLLIGLLFL
jgi:hypothetical protein